MAESISSAVSIITTTIGSFFDMLTEADGMGPLFYVSVAAGLGLLAVSFIKRLVWGA